MERRPACIRLCAPVQYSSNPKIGVLFSNSIKRLFLPSSFHSLLLAHLLPILAHTNPSCTPFLRGYWIQTLWLLSPCPQWSSQNPFRGKGGGRKWKKQWLSVEDALVVHPCVLSHSSCDPNDMTLWHNLILHPIESQVKNPKVWTDHNTVYSVTKLLCHLVHLVFTLIVYHLCLCVLCTYLCKWKGLFIINDWIS